MYNYLRESGGIVSKLPTEEIKTNRNKEIDPSELLKLVAMNTPELIMKTPSPQKKRKSKEQSPYPSKKKEYTPQYRSGGWAILVSMFKNSHNPLETIYTKNEIQKNATPYSRCDMYPAMIQGTKASPYW